MRTVLLFGAVFFLLFACDKQLPPEEQKRLQEKAKERVIQRVTSQQILDLVQKKTLSAKLLNSQRDSQANKDAS